MLKKMNLSWYLCLIIGLGFSNACKTKPVMKENIQTIAFRLKPGEDLQTGIENMATQHRLSAGWIATAVGSLTHYHIRFANEPAGSTGEGHFEIVSLTGTLAPSGNHLHLSISDSTGKTIGGHLLKGCTIYTTAEIVLMATNKYNFVREKDGSTDWEELQVREALK